MYQVLFLQQACGAVSMWAMKGVQKLSQKQRGSLGKGRDQTEEFTSDPGFLTKWWASHRAPVSSPLKWE